MFEASKFGFIDAVALGLQFTESYNYWQIYQFCEILVQIAEQMLVHLIDSQ